MFKHLNRLVTTTMDQGSDKRGQQQNLQQLGQAPDMESEGRCSNCCDHHQIETESYSIEEQEPECAGWPYH